MDLTLVLKAISKAPHALKLVRIADGSNESAAKLEMVAAQVDAEMRQVTYAVCRALVADAMGRGVNDQDVEEFLQAAIGSPGFPARAHRLLSEAKKSAAHRRRVFLTSILFGLPFCKIANDDRDRVDMVAERITADDLQLLADISRFEDVPPRDPVGSAFTVTYRGTFAAYIDGALKVGPGDPLSGNVVGPSREGAVPVEVNPLSFSALGHLGLIELRDIGQTVAVSADSHFDHLQSVLITPLGRLLLKALHEVRAGMDVPEPAMSPT